MLLRTRNRLYRSVTLGFVLAALCTLMLAAAPPAPGWAATGKSKTTARTVETATGPIRAEPVATGLKRPWSLVFLPDGSMLVAEESGQLLRVPQSGNISKPLSGLPEVYTTGNGGLLDVRLDPDFASNRRIYFAFAEPAGDGSGKAGTSVARAVLHKDHISDLEIIFRQTPKVADERNFGGRLAFAPDGTLFVMLGDRFALDLVQDLSNTIGALVRINADGSVPQDNPFVGRQGVRPEIWSYGHRNIEGGAFHPQTQDLWIHEFGPLGGDELNIPRPGLNYGWPLVSWGRHYSGEDIPDPPTRPELAQSIYHWNPVISPSGMTFYTGALIPEWQGNILIGGLSSNALIRLTLRGDRVIAEERIEMGARIRDIVQGPDGALYLLTDQPKGEILRLTAADKPRDQTSFEESVPD
ncbi:PQQ-dependent sugar dehydrogenase [Rhodospirillaceae bacterium SYSU D60014]|uniref:PQQ-dependent sugar dehydrogenase n=1 Tax=Virgifigura deserti TaxID=2268457 RepID=UPI000E673FA7